MSDEGPDIWLGLVDAVPIEPGAMEIGGAFVHVAAPADTWLELHAAADAALEDHGFRVADLDEAGSLRDRLRTGESIATELIVLALDAASAGEARLSVFHSYPPEDVPDLEAFAAEIREPVAAELRALAGARTLVCIHGHYDWHDTNGYVAGVGSEWTLIQLVDGRGLADGFLAVKLEAIASIDPIDPESSFLPRVVAARPVPVLTPDVNLDDTRALLEDAGRQAAVVHVVDEDQQPGAFVVARITAFDEAGLTLRKVSPIGRWEDDEVEFTYESVTRIGFGRHYEEALGLAADAELSD